MIIHETFAEIQRSDLNCIFSYYFSIFMIFP